MDPSSLTQLWLAFALAKSSAIRAAAKKGAERGSDDFGPAYRRAVSVRFVFFEPECDVGDGDLLVIEFILLQEMAHQRFSRRGRSHIFVQCFMPLS